MNISRHFRFCILDDLCLANDFKDIDFRVLALEPKRAGHTNGRSLTTDLEISVHHFLNGTHTDSRIVAVALFLILSRNALRLPLGREDHPPLLHPDILGAEPARLPSVPISATRLPLVRAKRSTLKLIAELLSQLPSLSILRICMRENLRTNCNTAYSCYSHQQNTSHLRALPFVVGHSLTHPHNLCHTQTEKR